jgi:hypothetical protein
MVMIFADSTKNPAKLGRTWRGGKDGVESVGVVGRNGMNEGGKD